MHHTNPALPMSCNPCALLLLLLALLPAGLAQENPERRRARDLGLIVGELPAAGRAIVASQPGLQLATAKALASPFQQHLESGPQAAANYVTVR